MSLGAILESVQKRFDASAIAPELAGLWLEIAPGTAALPYATFSLPLTSDRTFGEKFEDGTLTIRVFLADTTEEGMSPLQEIDRLGEGVKAAFDDCTLMLVGYTSIEVTRQSRQITRDPDGGWIYELVYKIEVQEA